MERLPPRCQRENLSSSLPPPLPPKDSRSFQETLLLGLAAPAISQQPQSPRRTFAWAPQGWQPGASGGSQVKAPFHTHTPRRACPLCPNCSPHPGGPRAPSRRAGLSGAGLPRSLARSLVANGPCRPCAPPPSTREATWLGRGLARPPFASAAPGTRPAALRPEAGASQALPAESAGRSAPPRPRIPASQVAA